LPVASAFDEPGKHQFLARKKLLTRETTISWVMLSITLEQIPKLHED